MTVNRIRPLAFAPGVLDVPRSLRRHSTLIPLIATLLLALSTLIAVTAVSIGIARAEAAKALADPDVVPFAVALFIGLLLGAMGGLTVLMTAVDKRCG